jgi:hypothetical protein
MKDDAVEPMDAELSGLLRRGAPVDAPADAQARVFKRLAATLPLGPGGGGGGPGEVQPTKAPPVPASVGAGVRLSTLALPLATFAVGIGLGALIMGGTTPTETVRTVYVDRVVPAEAPAAVAPPTVRVSDLPIVPSSPTPSASAARANGATANQTNAERALLDLATTAFARGEPAESLGALDRHRQRYPNGLFAEEREALAIRALVGLGRTTEARERGRLFVAKYPNSLMFPAVEAALREGPSRTP